MGEAFQKSIELLSNKLNTPKNISIIPHKDPDGDALGSCMGLALFLQNKNHNVSIISPNDFPDFLAWIAKDNKSISLIKYNEKPKEAEEILRKTDLIFTLDFNSLGRAGDLKEILKESTASKIMIDHHESPDDYAEIMFSYPKIASTCEIVYDVITSLEAKCLTKNIATCLYAGIMTDTGSFRFEATTSKTHKIVATLKEFDIESHKIHQRIFDSFTVGRMKLLGKALSNMQYLNEYNTTLITLTQEELDSTNFQKGYTEGFVNYGLSLKGIKFAVIMIENKKEGIIKISFRSKGEFSVDVFAKTYFNGGGHKNAAGGSSKETLKETEKKFKEVLPLYKKQLCTQ